MAEIKAGDVAKLRNMTGAGMMDCKKALQESNGDYDAAIDILRKKGQKVANKRADRDAIEGAVIAKVAADGKFGSIVVLNCETDFVAKNNDFVSFATQIADIAIAEKAANIDALKSAACGAATVEDEISNKTGVIGEKVDLSAFETIAAETVVAYIHPGNQVASLVGFNKVVSAEVGKDIAMKIAAMAPIAVDKDRVSEAMIAKEIEIGKELAIQEGKPADMAEKIAVGRLNKFFQESTLLNQQFIKDNKQNVQQYLTSVEKGLTVTDFKRFSLAV